MALLIGKVVGTPLLIVLLSLVARRFGAEGAGLLAGLPLASGPVAGLLVAAHGQLFGRTASEGILLGLLAAQAFMIAYALVAPRAAWPLTTLAAFAAFGLVAAGAYALAPPPYVVVPLVLFGLVAIQTALGPLDARRAGGPTDQGWPDLLLRAVLATALVVGLTGLSGLLGARLSGILAPIPVATALLAVFTHRTAGAHAARNLLRGVAGGAYSFWAFFALLSIALTRVGTPLAFAMATVLALAIQAWRLGRRRGVGAPEPSMSA